MRGHSWGGLRHPPHTPPADYEGAKPPQTPQFVWMLGILKLRIFFEDFDPMWPLQRSYCLENVRILSLSILGFHQNLSKILIFISQSPPFYENPISSVRPSETQNSRFLCVHPHSGGVVGFSIIGFSSMTPPPSDGGGGEPETKFPPGSRPSPPLAPRDKISRSGSPHSDLWTLSQK